MEKGDLALWTRPRYVVVIEGVLCHVDPVLSDSRWRRHKVVGHNVQWYDVPIKRLLYMKDRWPNTAQDLVTFIDGPFLEQAVSFLDDVGLQYDSATHEKLDQFSQLLRYKQDVQAVYDSDPTRLDGYGQMGRAVLPGEDFV